MIVVDGRTDEEKLVELLGAGAEETALDYKSTLDLSARASKDSVEFAKDAISMGNLPTGGYIVVGVDNQGAPAHDQSAVDAEQFDSAKLRAKAARYLEAQIHMVSQAHQVEGRIVIVIYVAPNPDGLPIPTSTIGQYDKGNGKMETVFVEGEVLIREGTSNVRLRYAHWNSLLERYRETIKAEARRDADELIRRVVEGFREGYGDGGGHTVVRIPLDPGMDDDTLTEAVVSLFEANSTVRVQQFLNDAAIRAGIGEPDERAARLRALDQIALIACQAILYRQDEVYRLAVTGLEKAYEARLLSADTIAWVGTDAARAQHYLDVLVRVLAIGALAVRREAWDLLPELSNRSLNESGYEWVSWLRHAVTMASRSNLLQDNEGRSRGGQALSLARALAADSPGLRPDYSAGTTLPKLEELSHNDWLLNSLCEFDLWWCILALANRPDSRDGAAYYPSCAAFHQWRSQSTLTRIATQPEVRKAAFRDTADHVIADSMLAVVRAAVSQSHQYGGWWDGFTEDPKVADFVNAHATGTTLS